MVLLRGLFVTDATEGCGSGSLLLCVMLVTVEGTQPVRHLLSQGCLRWPSMGYRGVGVGCSVVVWVAGVYVGCYPVGDAVGLVCRGSWMDIVEAVGE